MTADPVTAGPGLRAEAVGLILSAMDGMHDCYGRVRGPHQIADARLKLQAAVAMLSSAPDPLAEPGA